MKGTNYPMASGETSKTYRIGELAALFGVTDRTIRYYEELGLLQSEGRLEGKHRRYPGKNATYLRRIQQLKDYGLSLAEIRELFDLARQDRSGQRVRQRLAIKYKEKLEEAERRRALLEHYIADLSWHIEQLENGQDFFQCPGSSCTACPYSGKCDIRIPLEESL